MGCCESHIENEEVQCRREINTPRLSPMPSPRARQTAGIVHFSNDLKSRHGSDRSWWKKFDKGQRSGLVEGDGMKFLEATLNNEMTHQNTNDIMDEDEFDRKLQQMNMQGVRSDMADNHIMFFEGYELGNQLKGLVETETSNSESYIP